MDSVLLSDIPYISASSKSAFRKAGINTLVDLLLIPSAEISKQCRIAPLEVRRIVELVSKENRPKFRKLEDVVHEGNEKCTTGDLILDSALNGGIRTGMIWEIVGESAAGKTQMALQLSLTVQLPANIGGLSGSACYLTTSSGLPTSRLVQISKGHPLLSPTLCNLSNIHTISTPTTQILLHVLSQTLPNFLKDCSRDATRRPVKLLVIDALAELFRAVGKTSTSTLVERSRSLSEISSLLHALARTHNIAVLVLNEVVDTFDAAPDADAGEQGELIYRNQSRLFNRPDPQTGDTRKSASLGLVWANQVNVRIFMSRTGRRRYLDDIDGPRRRIHQGSGAENVLPNPPPLVTLPSEDSATLIRRLNIVFSSISTPTSLDYIVTSKGISTLPAEGARRTADVSTAVSAQLHPISTNKSTPSALSDTVSLLDVGCAEDGDAPNAEGMDSAEDDNSLDDEWETFWKEDIIPDEAYSDPQPGTS